MGSMTLEIDERYPPQEVLSEATRAARENVAGRVSVEPGDSWTMVIDVPRAGTSIPPTDVPMDEWDDVSPPSEQELNSFVESVRNRSNASDVNRENLGGGQYERITVKYD